MLSQRDVDAITTFITETLVENISRITEYEAGKRARQLLETQTAKNDYTHVWSIRGMDANINFTVDLGNISGEQRIPVRGYSYLRGGKRIVVSPYERKYINKRLFRDKKGQFNVSEHIPIPVMEDILGESVVEAAIIHINNLAAMPEIVLKES